MYSKIPAPLMPGDLLSVVATSGALREFEKFNQGIELWRAQGYRVEVCPQIDQRWGYLAGDDHHRRQQLMTALKDPDCRGILCARGGYGGTRLLEDWVWPEIEPKWLIGFSDITSLLWSWGRVGVSGVHGPLLTTLIDEPQWSTERLFNWVRDHTLPALHGDSWQRGQATGPLLPANLTVATCLLGTAHEPDLTGVILAFEDVTEAPYRIDRMLTHWRMLGKLETIGGIALGRFSQCDPPVTVPSFTALEVLQERLAQLRVPVVANLPFGHDGENAALPVGITAHLDGDSGILSFPDYDHPSQ